MNSTEKVYLEYGIDPEWLKDVPRSQRWVVRGVTQIDKTFDDDGWQVCEPKAKHVWIVDTWNKDADEIWGHLKNWNRAGNEMKFHDYSPFFIFLHQVFTRKVKRESLYTTFKRVFKKVKPDENIEAKLEEYGTKIFKGDK